MVAGLGSKRSRPSRQVDTLSLQRRCDACLLGPRTLAALVVIETDVVEMQPSVKFVKTVYVFENP